jgi:valyl-tRNA synthetase
VLLTVLDRSLRLLHPVMPFLTEEVWQRLPGHEAIHPATICLAPYPAREETWESAEVEADMEVLMHVVTRVRGLRSEMGLPPKARIALYLGASTAPEGTAEGTPEEKSGGEGGGRRARFLAKHEHLVRSLCRVESVAFGPPPAGAVRDLVDGVDVALAPEAGGLAAAERERLARELEKLTGEIERAERRLADPDFLAKAPPAVVAGGRERLAELRERQQRIRASLAAAAAAAADAGDATGGG